MKTSVFEIIENCDPSTAYEVKQTKSDSSNMHNRHWQQQKIEKHYKYYLYPRLCLVNCHTVRVFDDFTCLVLRRKQNHTKFSDASYLRQKDLERYVDNILSPDFCGFLHELYISNCLGMFWTGWCVWYLEHYYQLHGLDLSVACACANDAL